MTLNSLSENLEIEFPTEVYFKIIGNNPDEMLSAVNRIMEKYYSDISPYSIGKNKYYSGLNLSVIVQNDSAYKNIFSELRANRNIKIVF